ncbi:MAG: hypothetical protein CVV27_05550, partial [Candidatus Melainabacteria bacterium HGW-Melainabacteria-1]
MKRTLKQIIAGLSLTALTACSASMPPALTSAARLQRQSVSAGTLKAPLGSLRRYKQAQQQTSSAPRSGQVSAMSGGMRAEPVLYDSSPAPLPVLPPQPVNPISDPAPYTPPAAPSLPSEQQPGDSTQPHDGNTAPNAPVTGVPGGITPINEHFRYEDLQWHLRK